MMRDVLLVLAFLLGAGIMRVFVRIADHFIEHVVLPDDADIKCQMENEIKSTEDAPKEHAPGRIKRLLDKLRLRSKVKDKYRGTVVEIGTASPTQIRIRHYE